MEGIGETSSVELCNVTKRFGEMAAVDDLSQVGLDHGAAVDVRSRRSDNMMIVIRLIG